MPSPLRRTAPSRSAVLAAAVLAAAVLGVAAGGHALGAVSGVELVLPEHTVASPDGTGQVRADIRWEPPVFTPVAGHVDRIRFERENVTTGGTASTQSPPPFTRASLFGQDGSQMVIRVWGCQLPSPGTGSCSGATTLVMSDTAVTRLDATPPVASMVIAGGATFTNRREVTLDVAASDPLIAGIPGSSSGVTQVAVDADGDGTYPCDPLVFGGGGDRSGCARPFGPSVPFTLPEGDGPKTVGVRVGDGARPGEPPCVSRPGPRVCLGLTGGTPIQGNPSAPVTDTIVLDTAAPVAAPTVSSTSIVAGTAVSFDSALSSDPAPGTASGLDPAAATWDLGDGTAAAGPSVTHTYTRPGTFTGSLTVRDRAGNASAPVPFTVAVAPAPAAAAVVERPAPPRLRVTRLTRSVRVVRGRLVGSVTVRGTAAAGVVRLTVRRLPAGRRVTLSRRVRAGAFAATFRLPAGLTPGRFRLRVLAPGGAVARDVTVPLGAARR